MKNKILIIEDEKDLALTIEYNLQKEGFDTIVANTGYEALYIIQKHKNINLITLDWMLPDLSGIEVLKTLKGESFSKIIPILMLTAKSEEIDKVIGFELGIDDYLSKPFSMRELILRVKAILRRFDDKNESSFSILESGSIKLDADRHRVWISNKEITLTSLEFVLLKTFLERLGRVQSREVLLNDVWGESTFVTNRTVDTHVKRLRNKLEEASSKIETVRGVGYRMVKE